MARIDDVATIAGVSIKTVSRVLNDEPHVRPVMRDRVLKAVAQLDYRPNQSARRLAGGRSFMIALLYTLYAADTPSYVAAIQAGAARRCRHLGYHLVVEPIELSGAKRFEPLDRLVTALKPDGVCLVPPLSDDAALLERLASMSLSCARIAGSIPGQGFNVDTPERAAGRLVAEHLLALGHRRLGMVTPPQRHQAAMGRVEGFLEALQSHGVEMSDELLTPGLFTFRSGIDAAERLMALQQPPSAIFATNDEMALGVMFAAFERGIKIPEDLSIVGFDEIPASKTAWPPLTTVRQPLEEMGAAAIDGLLTGLYAGPALDLKLIVGATTGPATGTPA